MVVIIIIAILSTLGMVYYGNFLKNSRDVKRQSDLKFIQSALEDYHADNFFYPDNLTPLTSGYITELPKDPRTAQIYSYQPSECSGSACKKYCLYAALEGTSPASDPGCTSTGLYGVTRP